MFLSIVASAKMVDVAGRRPLTSVASDTSGTTHQPLQRPQVMDVYNKNMGAPDKADQMVCVIFLI